MIFTVATPLPKLTVRQEQALALLPQISPRGGHRVTTTPKGGEPWVMPYSATVVLPERTLDALIEKGYLRVTGTSGMALLVVRSR